MTLPERSEIERRLDKLHEGHVVMKAQHDHLDQCIDRLREQIRWQTRAVASAAVGVAGQIVVLIVRGLG